MNGESKRGIGREGRKVKGEEGLTITQSYYHSKQARLMWSGRGVGEGWRGRSHASLISHSCMSHPCLYSYLPGNRCREKGPNAVRSVKSITMPS